MPAIKVKPSDNSQVRDFWGDETEGAKLKRMMKEAYGDKFGVIKEALAALNLTRRLYNMYLTGERRIPDELWQRLKAIIKWNKVEKAWAKAADDAIDPLS